MKPFKRSAAGEPQGWLGDYINLRLAPGPIRSLRLWGGGLRRRIEEQAGGDTG